MKLLTSKQAAESPADGRADGERAGGLGSEQNDGPDLSRTLMEWLSPFARNGLLYEDRVSGCNRSAMLFGDGRVCVCKG